MFDQTKPFVYMIRFWILAYQGCPVYLKDLIHQGSASVGVNYNEVSTASGLSASRLRIVINRFHLW
jgi:hypothetical protein